jgi:tripartite-type tricarboxylate transporter receptor subunit TctC
LISAAGLLPLAAAATTWAASRYPARPITLIAPGTPGTTLDAVARFFAEQLSQGLGVPVVVENKAGAGGLLGIERAARAAPDGYTLLLTGIPLYLIPLFSDVPVRFNPTQDFAPVARLSRVPLAIIVPAESPYRSLGDLIQAMKATPNDITYSSGGVGSTAHLCAVLLNEMSGTTAMHIPYKGNTPAVNDVIGGRVTFSCQGSGGVLPLVHTGRMRALAVSGENRWDTLPGVPTIAEAGVPNYELSSWQDIVAPAGTPEPILGLLAERIKQAIQSPAFGKLADSQGLVADFVGHERLKQDVPAEAEHWKKIAAMARK